MRPEIRKVFTDPRYFVAFGLGSGLSPVAPGTAGSLAAIPLYFALAAMGTPGYVLCVVACLAAGIFLCDFVAKDMGVKDPSPIVFDEFVGMWISLVFLPDGWYWLPIGFALFRLFDILKPWPASWVDEHLGGGAGIMLDDAVAGVYALAVVQLLAVTMPGVMP
jgi:phosphatidylglycerophosphatase A